MNVQNNQPAVEADNLCKACKVFYGSEAFSGLCSSCFKYQFVLFKENSEIAINERRNCKIGESQHSSHRQ